MAALREQLAISEQIVGHRMLAVCRATIADALLQRNASGDIRAKPLQLLTRTDALCNLHELRESHPPILVSLAVALERTGDVAGALVTYRCFHGLQMQINSEAAERDAPHLNPDCDWFAPKQISTASGCARRSWRR